MIVQRPLDFQSAKNIPSLLAIQKREDILLFISFFMVVFSITPLLILAGAYIGFSILLGIIVALICASLIMRWPLLGLFLIVGCVVFIEQNPRPVSIFTDRLNIFYWPPQLAGLIERPIGFLIILVFLAFIAHRLIKREALLKGGLLFWPLLCFLICVAFGVVYGLATGGDLKIVVLEVRPLWYLFVSYLLAYNLITQKNVIRAFFWIVILGAGFKSLQGIYIYLVILGGDLTGQNEIMSHEESFFFVSFLLLLVLLCSYYRYKPQLYVSLILLPFVLFTLIANDRRADYVAFLAGVVVAGALLFLLKPHARKGIVIGGMLVLVLLTGYVLGFGRAPGALAAPARAIISIIDPTAAAAGDAGSNLYREIENYNLKYTVMQYPVTGLGFGKPFLQPVPLPDISDLAQYYTYVPHNTIYWIWMRLGPAGYLALWYLFGALIVRGCVIARQLNDPYLQMVAIYAVAVTFMEIIVAYADYQLFFYRNVIYLGLLAGILIKLPALDREEKGSAAHEITSRIPVFTSSDGGIEVSKLLPVENARKQT